MAVEERAVLDVIQANYAAWAANDALVDASGLHNRRVFDVQLGERIYVRGSDGTRQAQSLQVYTITSTGITRIVAFSDPGLFAAFGLPTTWSG